jgi:hypothetical protein
MLERVQAQRGHRRRVGHVPNAKNAAFLMQLVVISPNNGHAELLLAASGGEICS